MLELQLELEWLDELVLELQLESEWLQELMLSFDLNRNGWRS